MKHFQLTLFNHFEEVTPRVEIEVPPLVGIAVFHIQACCHVTHAILIDEAGEMVESYPFGEPLRMHFNSVMFIKYFFRNGGGGPGETVPDPAPTPKIKEPA
jgi:hypothetical protein